MSDIFEELLSSNAAAQQPHTVAYTINNYQPVQCTIIGSQPFFYMDIDPEDEEDFSDLSDADMEILAGELEKLKKEIEVYDRFSENFEERSEGLFQSFLNNKEDYTNKTLEKQSELETIMIVLENSRIAKEFLKCATDHNVLIKESAHVEGAEYDKTENVIRINSNLCLEDKVLMLSRELRRHWQHRQGAMINPLHFHPDQGILINRIQIADLTVQMIRVAWELQLAGYKNIWERIEFSPMADLGRALAREAFLDFRTLNNGLAATAVFEAWFLSERCKEADQILIQSMLADQGEKTSDLESPAQQITPSLISAFGTMPYGKNYLAPHVHIVMEDPIFTEVRDRSNANFLWFIKFERSFRETEQHLQSQEDLARNSLSMVKLQKDQDKYDANDAEIIRLFPQTAEYENSGDESDDSNTRLSKSDAEALHQDSAQIIDLYSKL